MSTMTFTGVQVHVNDDGFFTEPEEWTEEMAPEIAAREGVAELGDEHWQVIRFMRSRYLDKEQPPTARIVSRHCGISIRRFYQLFPRRPIRLAAKIAGVPQPRSYLGACSLNWGAAWK